MAAVQAATAVCQRALDRGSMDTCQHPASVLHGCRQLGGALYLRFSNPFFARGTQLTNVFGKALDHQVEKYMTYINYITAYFQNLKDRFLETNLICFCHVVTVSAKL